MKPLCYAPFVSLLSDSYKQYAPCCLSTRRFSFNSIEEYWNSEQLSSIRQQLIDQQWPDSCSVCKRDREAGLEDDTKFYDHLFSSLNLQINVPEVIDYRPSNKCNLKCRMCSPGSSNLIALEALENNIVDLYPNDHNVQTNVNDFVEFVSKNKIKRLKLLGGEPSIDPETHKILKHLIETNNTDLSLHIVTNITNFNRKFFSLLDCFSNVHFKLSIDAVGYPYEYIRTNAKWSNVEKYTERLLQENKFKSYHFGPVIMSFNAFNLIEMLEWYMILYNKGYIFYTNFQLSTIQTSFLSALYQDDIESISNELHQWAINKDTEFLKRINFNRLVNIVETTNHNFETTLKFVSFARKLDQIRGTNICNVSERFKRYFTI